MRTTTLFCAVGESNEEGAWFVALLQNPTRARTEAERPSIVRHIRWMPIFQRCMATLIDRIMAFEMIHKVLLRWQFSFKKSLCSMERGREHHQSTLRQ